MSSIFILSLVIVFSIFSPNWFNLLNTVYGHGLSRDESLPFDVSGRQIAIEGVLEPPFLNEGNQEPRLIIRTHDEKTNETIKVLDYRIIVNFKNETVLDERFHSIDGIVYVNFIPSNDTSTTTQNITEKNMDQVNIAKKDDLVKVSQTDPLTLKSKILSDGGLYDFTVILEKSSRGLELDSNKKVNLYITIGKNFPFVINNVPSNYSNDSGRSSDNNNVTLIVKTFYDEIQDFVYNTNNSQISFKMPFTWNLDYVNQVVNLHEEIVIPKDFTPLSQVSSFKGKLNGLEIPEIGILIDDYTDENNRNVHIVVANFKLIEFTNKILEKGGDLYAKFELTPVGNKQG